jgi:monoamine oxidase
MYQAMTALGHAAETQFSGPPALSGARAGASVLVLGAGLAGMLAAYELTKAGYKVQVLEYQDRPGGRNYSVRGGDKIVEVGGATQNVAFSRAITSTPARGASRITTARCCIIARRLG